MEFRADLRKDRGVVRQPLGGTIGSRDFEGEARVSADHAAFAFAGAKHDPIGVSWKRQFPGDRNRPRVPEFRLFRRLKGPEIRNGFRRRGILLLPRGRR
jgi:hypothetical protein